VRAAAGAVENRKGLAAEDMRVPGQFEECDGAVESWRGGGGGGGHTAVSRGSGGPGPSGAHAGTAVPRQGPPPGSYGHGHYQHGYYGGHYGYGYPYFYGGFYYPPFVSFYGWYPYSFGWYGGYWGGWGGYPYYGPYWGPYDNTASVRLQVTPRDAEVYVDGYYAGVVDDFDGTFQRLRLLPGAHEVTIWMAGYRSATERMYFRPTGGYKVSHTLEKLAAGQPEEPKPQPTAAPETHRHDRYDYGRRPDGGEPEEPTPGGRGPEPRWPDQAHEPRTAPPGEGRPLGPEDHSTSSFGSLALRVQPSGAAVTIDGERWQSPDTQDRLVVQLAVGRHHVEIRKDGFTPYSGDVEVHGGETTALNVSLPPADQR